jgi:hypothetical protein
LLFFADQCRVQQIELALDSEALYTIIGGLKPMSGGFALFKFSVEKPDLAQIPFIGLKEPFIENQYSTEFQLDKLRCLPFNQAIATEAKGQRGVEACARGRRDRIALRVAAGARRLASALRRKRK